MIRPVVVEYNGADAILEVWKFAVLRNRAFDILKQFLDVLFPPLVRPLINRNCKLLNGQELQNTDNLGRENGTINVICGQSGFEN